MDYEDEQNGELEALSEIYYDEITGIVISNKHPISFIIKIRPQVSSCDKDVEGDTEANSEADDSDDDSYEEDDENNVGDYGEYEKQTAETYIRLRFDLPKKYPDEKPDITHIDHDGFESDKLDKIMQMVDSVAESSKGEVMVFTIVSEVVEWLQKLETDAAAAAAALESGIDSKKEARKVIEERRFDGTPVTMQTFMEWKVKFDAERFKDKLMKQAQVIAEQGSAQRRLTGRAMFEADKTLAESDLNIEDLDQGQLDTLIQNIEDIELETLDEFEDEDLDVLDDGGDDNDEDDDEVVDEVEEKEEKGKIKKK